MCGHRIADHSIDRPEVRGQNMLLAEVFWPTYLRLGADEGRLRGQQVAVKIDVGTHRISQIMQSPFDSPATRCWWRSTPWAAGTRCRQQARVPSCAGPATSSATARCLRWPPCSATGCFCEGRIYSHVSSAGAVLRRSCVFIGSSVLPALATLQQLLVGASVLSSSVKAQRHCRDCWFRYR